MTDDPTQSDIEELAQRIEDGPWEVVDYDFSGGKFQTFTTTLEVEWDADSGDFDPDAALPDDTPDHTGVVKDVVADLADDYDGGAPIEEVHDKLESVGVAPDAASAAIESLRMRGEIYEPQQDHLRVV